MSLEGILLTTVGVLISMIGIVLIAFGSMKKTMSRILWKDQVVSYLRPQYSHVSEFHKEAIEYPNYVFSLQHPSKVRVEISSTSGPYTLYLSEYVGPGVNPGSLSQPMLYHKDRDMPQGSFELELPSGSYCLLS